MSVTSVTESFNDLINHVEKLANESPDSNSIDNNTLFGGFRKESVTVTLGKELWPTDEQILLVSIDDNLNLVSGSLHQLVLQKIGVSIEEIEFEKKDYTEIRKKGLVSKSFNSRIVYFISTIQRTKANYSSDIEKIQTSITNIFKEFDTNVSFESPSFYIPLLGTGTANISIMYSFDLAMTAIENLATNSSKEFNITLSLPPEITNGNANKIISLFNEKWSFSEEQIIARKSTTDKIDFLLDRPTLYDKLGRRPIARSLARLINNDVFSNASKKSSFMIHLQGKWGEGKTSFMNFLEQELKKEDEADWIIIKYNAWKNQHIDPPWWTFIDSLYQQGKDSFKGRIKFNILWSEFFRRLNHKTLISLIFIGLISLGIIQAIDWLNLNLASIDTIKATTAVFTFGLALFALGKKGSDFFFVNSPKSVRLFINHVEDPTAHIKKHFKELFNLISSSGIKNDKDPNRIAFFIDDLDRCNAQFVVKLLEGIQTLFREQKVLYLIAADKDWISESFENVYSDYKSIASQNGASLGNFFVEKNFQLSLRLPNPSNKQVDNYWKFLLNNTVKEETNSSGTEGLIREVKKGGKEKLISGEKNVNELADKYKLSVEETQNVILDNLDENDEDIQHLLQDYGNLIGSNPRTIKRIANQYTIFRNLVLLEQNKVDQVKLFRWVILLNRFPLFVDVLTQKGLEYIENFENDLKPLNDQRLSPYINIIREIVGNGNEKLTKKDVEIFMGIKSISKNK